MNAWSKLSVAAGGFVDGAPVEPLPSDYLYRLACINLSFFSSSPSIKCSCKRCCKFACFLRKETNAIFFSHARGFTLSACDFFDRNNHTGFVMCSVTARKKMCKSDLYCCVPFFLIFCMWFIIVGGFGAIELFTLFSDASWWTDERNFIHVRVCATLRASLGLRSSEYL